MLKTLLIILIIVSAFTILGQLIPDQFTTEINNAFIFFLSQINNLSAFSPAIVSAVFGALRILGNYMITLSFYFVVRFALNLIS